MDSPCLCCAMMYPGAHGWGCLLEHSHGTLGALLVKRVIMPHLFKILLGGLYLLTEMANPAYAAL